ncbi:MAG: DUF4258 domain-containing protein [Chitinophagaceae bacterium]|nr:DUF4258 domain-containing protein [Chitinophagaceae bacterium]MCW5928724.1 DUF4258 domain-containing protein [Chitinophagaceae bacterium]
MKKYRFYLPLILILIAGAGLLLNKQRDVGIQTEADAGFDRQLRPLIYTRHARCRMDCRRIDEAEVEDILTSGVINHEKTDIHSKPDPKYALEGRTRDNQEVRIIFAPTRKGMVVITCIDIKNEWHCNCK